MGIKTTITKARAKYRLNQLSNWDDVIHADIPIDIPKERTLFPATESDFWYNVDLNTKNVDATSCIYELAPNSVFKGHFHNEHTELFLILTPGAKIEIVTYDYVKFLSFYETAYFDKAEVHALKNHSDFPVKILVIWQPQMKQGFGANFIKNVKR